MSKIKLASITCSLVALVVSTGFFTAAYAGEGTPTPAGGDSEIEKYVATVGYKELDHQQALSDFRSWITSLPDIEEAGYVELVANASDRTGKVLWHGPSQLRDVVSAKASSRGIAISFSERPQARVQIRASLVALRDHTEDLEALGFTVQGIAGISDNDGSISVIGHASSGMRPDLASVEALAAKLSGGPVKIVDRTTVSPAVATRSNDWQDFNAGGYMKDNSGHVCSTGFAMSTGGFPYTMTARHCEKGPWYARNNSATWYGNEWKDAPQGQASILQTRGSANMFDGAWNNAAGYYKVVQGFQDVGLGDSVCTSGGNSGVHCAIKVDNMWYLWNDGFGWEYNIHATHNNTDIAAIQGDSGGPVLMPYSNGKVGAVGMIQAVVNGWTGSCGAVHDLYDNICAREVLFTSSRTIANGLGWNLVTG